MRIISGIRRGHKLLEFEGSDIRPTTDRVKESVFNLIQSFVPDAVCLDMFAGSGALSMEALSRGARYSVLTDTDFRAVDIIKRNALSLGFSERCEIKNTSCFDYMARTEKRFDIIFLDPPYNKGLIEPALCAVVQNNILSEGGIAVLESDNTDFCGEVDGLEIYRQRKYGRTYITVYKKKLCGEEESK